MRQTRNLPCTESGPLSSVELCRNVLIGRDEKKRFAPRAVSLTEDLTGFDIIAGQ
jgi:hypothetical protein